MDKFIDSIEDESLKKHLKLVNAIRSINNDLVVTGSLSQFLHLEKLYRKVTDIDVIIPTFFDFSSSLKQINEIVSSNYEESSYFKYSRDGYKIKLVNSVDYRNKKINDYTSIDVKTIPEPYEIMFDDFKIVLFEKLISNKIATSLIGNGVNHYLRSKDLYDLNFLLNSKDFDYDLMTHYLTNRLFKNGIDNIYKTFLFTDEAENTYTKNFDNIKEKYRMNQKVDLMYIRDYLTNNSKDINKKLSKIR